MIRNNKLILVLFLLGLSFIFAGIFLPQSSKPNVQTVQDKASTQSVESSSIQKEEPKTLDRQILITKVIDGDTIQSSTGEEIRYIGINSPEGGEPFSDEALQKNRELVLGRTVELEFDVQKKDRFGRTLAYVFTDQKLVNVELVRVGVAVSQTIAPNVKYQDQIVEAQRQARENCLGIWKGLCDKSSVQGSKSSNSCVKIASINADAPGNDNNNKNGEWIVFKNSCSQTISMQGWLLKDTSASNKYEFKNFSMNLNQEVTLYSGCGQDSQTQLYWKCPEGKYAVWNNAGDHAFLYNDRGELISDYEY